MSEPEAIPESGAVPDRARAARLQTLLAQAGLAALTPDTAARFAAYLSLFIRWNARTNLSAIRDEEGIIRRHLIESIAVAYQIPAGVTTLLDYGSGGGLPGIPIALCRHDIHVTLAESQNKKAAFLREAVRILALDATVHAARAETLPHLYDCVTLRAVDHMEIAVASAAHLVRPGGHLVLMTTIEQFPSLQAAAGPAFHWLPAKPLPNTREGLIAQAVSSVA
jgi:16S rRNA (guanine527-N7)-methyltransferase